MPKFQKDFPQNAIHYFDPASDEAFKKKHPVGYVLLVVCGIVVLVLPLVALILVTEVWFPAPNSGFLVMAMGGCFIIGIGLFNIVAAWIGQYLGHWVTAGCFALGGVLVSISLVIIYNPDIYALFDERMVAYYFATMIFIALPPIFYLIFRFAVGSWLRRKGISKTRMKKLMKGKRNYWWYESLREEFDLGLIYHANKLVTILYPIHVVLAVALGWARFMTPVITGLYVMISVLSAGMSLFSSAQNNIEAYGTPFVILRRTKNQGFTSSLLDLAVAAVPLSAGYAHILVMLDALNIPR